MMEGGIVGLGCEGEDVAAAAPIEGGIVGLGFVHFVGSGTTPSSSACGRAGAAAASVIASRAPCRREPTPATTLQAQQRTAQRERAQPGHDGRPQPYAARPAGATRRGGGAALSIAPYASCRQGCSKTQPHSNVLRLRNRK